MLETATGRELFRLLRHGWQARLLSDDASTLLTVDAADGDAENRFIVRIWEVRPTRAYLWAMGAALATGMVLRMSARFAKRIGNRGRANVGNMAVV